MLVQNVLQILDYPHSVQEGGSILFFNPVLLTGELDHAEYHTLLQGCGSGSRRGKFEGKTEKVRKTEENCNCIIKY